MIRSSLSLVTLCAALAVPAALPAQDAPDDRNQSLDAAVEPGAPAALAEAHALYARGLAQGDALMVAAAARLAASAEGDASEPSALDPALLAEVGTVQEAMRKKAASAAPAAPAPMMNTGEGEMVAVPPGQAVFAKRKAAGAAPAAPAPIMKAGEGAYAPTAFAKRKAAGASPAAPAPVMRAEDGAARPVGKAASGEAGGEDGAAMAPVDAAGMLAMALELASGDEALTGVIEDAAAEGGRGRIGGAAQFVSTLPGGRYEVWEIAYAGGYSAELAVVGDGDADLDMVLTDAAGNVICYDASASDSFYCGWVPAWDGYFYVTVENVGGLNNSYALVTN